METKAAIIQLLDQHLEKYPSDTESLQPFFTFLHAFEGINLFSRKNFIGHITASAFIINTNGDQLLLLQHKALNRWLQPGGHVDILDENLLDAALREAEEETGILRKNLKPVFNFPFDFDSHFIPANPGKQEPSHYHHDVRFLFICSLKEINISPEESTSAKWNLLADISEESEFKTVAERIQEIVKSQILHFNKSMVKTFKGTG